MSGVVPHQTCEGVHQVWSGTLRQGWSGRRVSSGSGEGGASYLSELLEVEVEPHSIASSQVLVGVVSTQEMDVLQCRSQGDEFLR